MIVGEDASLDRLESSVLHSLDRKVCNTLNVVTVIRHLASVHVPIVLKAAEMAASARGTRPHIHAIQGAEEFMSTDVKNKSNQYRFVNTTEFIILLISVLYTSFRYVDQWPPIFLEVTFDLVKDITFNSKVLTLLFLYL